MGENLEELLKNSETSNILYDSDGSIKPFYILSSERDIKETQIKSDENELDFKYSQGTITKEEYEKGKENLKSKLYNQNSTYNDLIFMEIDYKDIEDIKEELKNASLNKIALERLATSLTSIIEKNLEEFNKNNKSYNDEDFKEWNSKYTRLAGIYSKMREIESFIQNLNE